jgi:hypothetical protein
MWALPQNHAMNKISGNGQFRADGAQPLIQSVMTVDAISRPARDNPSSKVISLVIHEKLPLMNGQAGCEVEIQITPEQAVRMPQRLFEAADKAGPLTVSATQDAIPTP